MAFNFEEFLKKHYVHPETIAFFKARQADNVKPYFEIGVDQARQVSKEGAAKYGGFVDLEGTEKEHIIPSPYCKDGIPITVYKPTSCDKLEAPGILVYFHGGGNTVGCRKTHETVCKILARDTPCIVVNVEYRLAPEHKFPANIDDSTCAVEWVAANKTAVGGSSKSKLGVSGDSAGGKLAAIVCHEATSLIDFAVLVYPSVSYMDGFPSQKEFENGPVLSKEVSTWFMDQYITDADKSNPRASVIRNNDFSYLPPTQIIVADLDPLRDGCYGVMPPPRQRKRPQRFDNMGSPPARKAAKRATTTSAPTNLAPTLAPDNDTRAQSQADNVRDRAFIRDVVSELVPTVANAVVETLVSMNLIHRPQEHSTTTLQNAPANTHVDAIESPPATPSQPAMLSTVNINDPIQVIPSPPGLQPQGDQHSTLSHTYAANGNNSAQSDLPSMVSTSTAAYCEKLKDAGVKVELKTIKGVPHAFWSLPEAYKETCKEAHEAAVKFIKEHCV